MEMTFPIPGDDGSTGLGDGTRVAKESLRVEAYGTVDETNSALGVVLSVPSLAPQIVEEIFEIVKGLNEREGVSFLLAEQNTYMALRFARYGYILENGRVVMDGDAKSLAENEDVKEFYLGISEGRRKSFRDGKHYRRRKRWLA